MTFSPQTSHLHQGENPLLTAGPTHYQTSLYCCTHSAALHRIRRGTKRREKHLFNEPSPGCLSLPFSPFFCSKPAPRSIPCTTDGSGSIQRRDLWSLIAGKQTWGWGCLEGSPPDLFSSNRKKKRHQKRGSQVRLGLRMGDCRKHFQGCHLGRVGPFKLPANLQPEPLPYQMDKAVGKKGHITTVRGTNALCHHWHVIFWTVLGELLKVGAFINLLKSGGQPVSCLLILGGGGKPH